MTDQATISPSTVRPLKLREVKDALWQVHSLLGGGRIIDFASQQMRLELFMPPWTSVRPAQTMFDTAVQCRLGVIWTDGKSSIWSLVGGVPLSAPNASPAEQRLRLSIALARFPAVLVEILGPLALKWTAVQPSPHVSTTSDVVPVPDDDFVEMMLRATRQDVTVYCRAAAPASLWLRLLQSVPEFAPSSTRSSPATPSALAAARSRDDALTVSIPVALGRGRVAVGALTALQPGDVVRLENEFRTDGFGRIHVGELEIDVRWRARSPQHVFEVVGVSTVQTLTTASMSNDEALHGQSPEIPTMNSHLHDPSFHEDDASAMDNADSMNAAAGVGDSAQAVHALGSTPDPGRRDPERADIAFDQLKVVVVAELGTLTIKLGTLRAVQPGSLLKLGMATGGEVALRTIDGPPIAYGEMVDIEGHIGLQITRVVAA
ncbi:hypothetical protein BH09PSE5_BH09PSE5_16830 [soil metagenome]